MQFRVFRFTPVRCASCRGPPQGRASSLTEMCLQYIWACMRWLPINVQLETPLEEAKQLSAELGNHLLLKREDLQTVSIAGRQWPFNIIPF